MDGGGTAKSHSMTNLKGTHDITESSMLIINRLSAKSCHELLKREVVTNHRHNFL